MSILLAIILPALLGFIVISLLLARDGQVGLLERLAIAYPLGMGLLTLQLFLLGLARIPLTLKISLPLLLLEIFVLAGLACWKKVGLSSGKELPSDNCKQPRHIYEKIGELLLTLWLGLKLLSIFVETSLRPIYSHDAVTNWSVRAKAFFYSESLLLADPAATDFFGKGISHSIGSYPPFNPLAQVWMAQWAGSFDEVLVKFWMPFFLLSVVLFLFVIVAKELNRLLALVMVILFASSPLVSLHATQTVNELPLAAYILFAHVALLKVIRGRVDYLPLTGLFAVLAMFTKAEGVFIALPMLAAAIYASWPELSAGWTAARKKWLSLVAPYLLILPWFSFKLGNNLGLDPESQTVTFSFSTADIIEYILDFIVLNNFNVIFIFIPLVLLLLGRLDREIVLMIFPIAFYALFFLSLYVLIEYYSFKSLGGKTDIFRNTMTYFPSACLLLTLLLQRLLAKTETRG